MGPLEQLRGARLYRRYTRTGDRGPRSLHAAVRVFRAVVPGSPLRQRATCLSNLSEALRALALQTGDLEVLHEAVTVGRSAVAAAPGRFAVLANLGCALRYLFDRTEELDTLRESVECCREAAAAAPEDLPDQAVLLSNLGITLYMLARCTDYGRPQPGGPPGQP